MRAPDEAAATARLKGLGWSLRRSLGATGRHCVVT